MPAKLHDIVRFLDEELNIPGIQDYPHALNGLQLENDGSVTRICTAVDASEKAIQQAIGQKADLLIVHHGLFWSGLQPITGAWHRKLAFAIRNNLAVYSAHLPLDIHPTHGNNAILARELGMEITVAHKQEYHGILGVQTSYPGTLSQLIDRIKQATSGPVQAYLQQPLSDNPGAIMVCSGGAGAFMTSLPALGINTYITGEGEHWTIPMAAEMGINLIYAGHYETETFGVQALGNLLEQQFGIPASFLPAPPSAYSYHAS